MPGAGCASGPHAQALPPPPSEDVRAHLGTIGFVRAENLTNCFLRKPMTSGATTALGAGKGALWGLGAGAEAGRGGRELGAVAALLVWSVAIPVGTLVGAAAGNKEGLPAQERRQAEEQLHRAVLEADVQRLLNDEVLRSIGARTREAVVPLDPRTGAYRSESSAGSSAANGAIDTIMEVTVLNAGLAGGRDRSSLLMAFLQVRVRLLRANDGAELYAHTWLARGGSATFEDWAAYQARAMRQELPRVIPPLAQSVVEELFLVYDPKQSGKRK
jgi:hypothetical protein